MKKIISLLLTLAMTVGSVCVGFADDVKFSDIDAESESGKGIYKLVDAGIINGYEDGTFRIGANLTRAELCKMINKTFGFKTMADNVFVDVSTWDWYYLEVLTAISAGYINGFEDGTFRGDDNVSREQVCAILNRIIKKTADSPAEVADTVSDWAEADVKNIIALGYFPIEEGNTFRAEADITRGELAAALVVVVNERPAEEKKDDKTDADKKDDKKDDGTSSSTSGNSSSSSSSSSSSGSSSSGSSSSGGSSSGGSNSGGSSSGGSSSGGSNSGGSSSGGSSSGNSSSEDTGDDNTSTVDQKKVDDVIAKINAIGEITEKTLDDNKIAVNKAESAYNALNDEEKAAVTNYDTLTAAKETYAQVEAELSAKICKNLSDTLTDMESKIDEEIIQFDDKGTQIAEYFIKDIKETLASAEAGTIITNTYVRTTYADDTNSVKTIIGEMTDEEKASFKQELYRLNTVSLIYLSKYFEINVDYI